LKLIDFNISRYLPDGGALSPNCTQAFAAPEVRKGGSPSEASDIWGAGLCLNMMLSGRCPYWDGRHDVPANSFELPYLSEPCRATLKQCLALDHSMRPAAMTLLRAAWVCGDTVADGSAKRSRSCLSHSRHEDTSKPSSPKRSSKSCPRSAVARPLTREGEPGVRAYQVRRSVAAFQDTQKQLSFACGDMVAAAAWFLAPPETGDKAIAELPHDLANLARKVSHLKLSERKARFDSSASTQASSACSCCSLDDIDSAKNVKASASF